MEVESCRRLELKSLEQAMRIKAAERKAVTLQEIYRCTTEKYQDRKRTFEVMKNRLLKETQNSQNPAVKLAKISARAEQLRFQNRRLHEAQHEIEQCCKDQSQLASYIALHKERFGKLKQLLERTKNVIKTRQEESHLEEVIEAYVAKVKPRAASINGAFTYSSDYLCGDKEQLLVQDAQIEQPLEDGSIKLTVSVGGAA